MTAFIKTSISIFVISLLLNNVLLSNNINYTSNTQSINLDAYTLVQNSPINVADDVSGATYNPLTNTLFLINNNTSDIYEITLSGNLLRIITLIGFDDTEGIVHVDGTQFAVSEERRGRIAFFDINSTTSVVNYSNDNYVQLSGAWGTNQGLEGVTYNPVGDTILTIREKNPKGFYSFAVPSSLPDTLDADIVCNMTSSPFGLSDISGVHYLGLSGATNSTTSKHTLLLSDESLTVVEVDQNCNQISQLNLPAIPQPEGITMDNNGTLYIVSEPNLLYIFTPPINSCRQSDSLSLVELYNSTNGPNWTNTWNLNQPMDTWYGVTLNGDGCVTCLDLNGGSCLAGDGIDSGNNLVGTIPSELGNLSNLINLDLGSNQLSGNIPPELGNLGNLITFELRFTQLNGNIPSELGGLTNLEWLELSFNQLTGNIPSEIGNLTNLKWLELSFNQLTGNIPSELDNLVNLTTLYLCNNQLIGSIPSELGNLVNLTNLYLCNNQLTGSIPSEIGNLVNLTNLYLYNNQLTGSIPSEIGNLINLVHLRLLSNQLTGNIPLEIGNLIKLIDLRLSDNDFTGSIPPEIGNLTNLTNLYLYANQLSGCYDSNLINLCNQLNPIFNTNTYISNGNNFDAPWEDFCATGAGTCTDDVLPGDCNGDGIVNTDDALYWGLAEGFNGAVRPNATTDCSLQAAPDWLLSVNNVNSKHQDGDGSGIIDGDDLQVLISNFGCVSNYAAPNYASAAPNYRVQPQGINADGKYQYDLYVENGSGAAAIAHGLAFTVSSDVIPISAIAMSTTGSSLHPDEAFAIPDGNQCHVALTRTDNFDITCSGPIATFLVETSDIPVGIPFEIDVAYGSKIKADATLDNVTGATAFGMYNGFVPNSSNIFLDAAVTHEQCNGLGKALVIPFGGTPPYAYVWNNGANTAQVNDLTSGIYTVIVIDSNGLNQSLTLRINGQTPIYDANGNLLCGNLCPEYLAPSGITGNGLYSANNALNSDAIIPTGNTAQYKAGQIIELKPGFKVQPDAGFSAEIEDCQ